MDNTEILIVWLWLKLRDFYRRNKLAIFVLLIIAGVVVVSILLNQRKGEISLNAGPEWNDWNPPL